MVRQSPERRSADERSADEPDAGLDTEPGELDTIDGADVDEDEDDGSEEDEADEAEERDPATVALWAETRIDPIEVALPTGVGYTLRGYRPSAEVTATDLDEEEADDEEDPFARLESRRKRANEDEELEAAEPDEVDDAADDDADEGDAESVPDDDELEVAAADEEDVPVFLSHRGRILLFRSAESLVEFVRSGAEHDLAELDTWAEVVDRVRPEDVAPTEEDVYGLDLVVENLRGGHDAWDAELLIGAGELARDVAYAMRSEAILAALSPGSPLDDLDEALRASVSGGLSGFLARRRLKKIGAQQATLGWRTIIGKISGFVVWRD